MSAELKQTAATGAPASGWKPYPAYKDSGVEWIGRVPEHWEVWKLKWVSNLIYGSSLSNDERIEGKVPVYGSNGIIGYHNQAISIKPCIIIGRKGSFGKVNYSNIECFPIDTTYYIDETATKNNLSWLLYVLYTLNLDGLSKDSAVPGLSREDAYDKSILVPPLPEQRAISLYLDDRTQKIDSLIEKKQKLIDLLKEERTVIINQAVTRGLNPDAPMKDSGIEWLGEMPKHWKIKRMKYVAEIKSSNVDKKSSDNEIKVFLCNYLDVYKNEYIDNSFSFMEATANENEITKFIVKKGDVLVTKDSETPDDIANPAYIKDDLTNTICGYHLAQIRANQIELIGEYLFRLFQSKKFNSHFEVSANGITRFGLSIDSFKLVLIPLPPIEEQNEIAKYIETSTQKIHRTISRIEKEITLLQEYRTALISEVITGKIDVREAA